VDYKFKKRITFGRYGCTHQGNHIHNQNDTHIHTRASKNKNKNRQPKCGLEKNEKAMGVVEASFHTTTKNVVQLKYSNK
jgi:hypothetical protein